MIRRISCLFILLCSSVAFALPISIGKAVIYPLEKTQKTVGVYPDKKLVTVSNGESAIIINHGIRDSRVKYTKILKNKVYELIFTENNNKFYMISAAVVDMSLRKKTVESRCEVLTSEPPLKAKNLANEVEKIILKGADSQEFSEEDYIDESCDHVVNARDLYSSVAQNLSLDANPILTCLANSAKESKILRLIGEESYLSLANSAAANSLSGKFPKIRCEQSKSTDKNIYGKFVSGEIVLIKENNTIKADTCNPVLANISHEYLHQLLVSGSEKNDEKKIQALEKICGNEFGATSQHECQFKKQSESAGVSEIAVQDTQLDKNNELASIKALTDSSQQITADETLKAQVALSEGANISINATKVSEAGWNSIAEAKPGVVPPAARQIIKAANSSLGAISQFADQAINLLSTEAKASVAPPLASNATGASSLGSQARSSSKKNSSTPQESDFKTVEEYLVGDERSPRSSATTSQGPTQAQQMNVTTKITNSGASSGKDLSAKVSGGTQGLNQNFSTGESSGQLASSTSSVPQNFKPQVAGVQNAPRKNQASRSPASASSGIQILTTQQEITGQEYRLIRRLYNDQDFKADLINRQIHIKTRAAALGVSPVKAKQVFEDDGSKLIRVGE